MHYKNGREAKAGDTVVALNGPFSTVGVLYAPSGGSDTCNGRLAITHQNDPYINIKDCLHVDDVQKLFEEAPPAAAA